MRNARARVASLLAVVVALIETTPALAAAGDLDTTFSTDGKQTTDLFSGYDVAYGLAIQSDGKIVIAGTTYNGANNDFGVARYVTGGSLDTTFSGDGMQTVQFGSAADQAEGLALQPDGKLVAVGSTNVGGNWDVAVARLRAGGGLDAAFSGDGKRTVDLAGADDDAYAAAVQEDGKIVVAGSTSGGGGGDFLVVRLNADGSLDTSFAGDGKKMTDFASGDDVAYGVAIQDDGRIVVAGYANNAGNTAFALARYDTNGSLDNGFSRDGKRTTDFASGSDNAYGVALQGNGKIVVAGHTDTGADRDFAVARYTARGSLDPKFSGDGKQTTGFSFGDDEANAVAIQADGKIVAAGSATQADLNLAVVRFKVGGGLDTTFSTDGKQTTSFGFGADAAEAVAIQGNGEIVAAGQADNGANRDFALARYLAA